MLLVTIALHVFISTPALHIQRAPLQRPPAGRLQPPQLNDNDTRRSFCSPSQYEQKEQELARAVEAEDYDSAASLRDELNRLVVDDQAAIAAVNSEFYAAFTAGSYERMGEVWADDAITCIHPRSEPIYGRDDVMDSWKRILVTARMDIRGENVRCMLVGNSAVVTCTEVMDGISPLVATNVFAKTVTGKWKMILHHAGQVTRRVESLAPLDDFNV